MQIPPMAAAACAVVAVLAFNPRVVAGVRAMPAQAAGVSFVVIAAGLLARKRLRRAREEAVLLVSIPEVLGSVRCRFLRGEEKVAIFEALLPVIPGDPGILEEIWDEMNGTHNDWEPHRAALQDLASDFMTLLLDSIAKGDGFSSCAVTFVEHITKYDEEWDDEDEWNAMVLQILGFLKEPRYFSRLEKLAATDKRVQDICAGIKKRGGRTPPVPPGVAPADLVVTNAAKSSAKPTKPTPPADNPPAAKPAEISKSAVELMGLNSRVQDVISLAYCDATHTCACLNVVYASRENMVQDAARHSTFCPLAR
jgi:hypothetical protein